MPSSEESADTVPLTVKTVLPQPVYLITDGGGLRRSGRLISSIEAALEGAKLAFPAAESQTESTAGGDVSGIGIIQLREQVEGGGSIPATDQEVLDLAGRLLPVCRKYGTKLVINRRVDLALAAGVDGVHLGADSIRLLPAERSKLLFGYSAHRIEEGQRAIEKGFDYLLFSPVFEPLSKQSARAVHGREDLARLCGSTTAPVFALGGITPQNARSCRVSGASGIAVITAILGQPDPGRAAAELLAAWTGRKN